MSFFYSGILSLTCCLYNLICFIYNVNVSAKLLAENLVVQEGANNLAIVFLYQKDSFQFINKKFSFLEPMEDLNLQSLDQTPTSCTFSVFSKSGNFSVSEIRAECVSGCASKYIRVNPSSKSPGGWLEIFSLHPDTIYEVIIISAKFDDSYAPKKVDFKFSFCTRKFKR